MHILRPRAKPLSEHTVATFTMPAAARSPQVLNAFTVDVEDYFQVSAFEKHVPRDQWDRWESRVVANTHRVLQLLDRHRVKATFFVLGWVGERYPQLVRDIHACGHEIGSHGYWHRLIYEQTPDEFRADLRRSRDVLQEAIGQPVTAYRAASFSITKQSLWALEILVEEGFLVDSSVFPIHHDRYGIPGAEPQAAPPDDRGRSAVGVPSFGCQICRAERAGERRRILSPLPAGLDARIACAGSTGPSSSRSCSTSIRGNSIPEQPRIRAASRTSRFRHYVNLGQQRAKTRPAASASSVWAIVRRDCTSGMLIELPIQPRYSCGI